jgi:hypothetical protein
MRDSDKMMSSAEDCKYSSAAREQSLQYNLPITDGLKFDRTQGKPVLCEISMSEKERMTLDLLGLASDHRSGIRDDEYQIIWRRASKCPHHGLIMSLDDTGRAPPSVRHLFNSVFDGVWPRDIPALFMKEGGALSISKNCTCSAASGLVID